MSNGRLVKLFIILVISVSLLISTWSRKWLRTSVSYNYNHNIQETTIPAEANMETKRILFWYEPFPGRKNKPGFGELTSVNEDTQILDNCDLRQRCEVTSFGRINDHNRLKSYDAIIYHQRSWNPDDVPKCRWPHQRYVFLTMESPAWRMTDTESMAGFFNWTMTYRRDSDIYNPYGWFSRKGTHHRKRLDTSYRINKSKMAAWFVSNCKSLSNRNEFVKALKKYVDVDIYGKCGHLRCPRSQSDKCKEMIERDYKFYLSLENSLCQDYVTEKFFSMLHYNVVPVVFDLHGNLARIAPKRSFINAADFPSVEKLAHYLIKLNQSDVLYNEYFSWKRHFHVRDSPSDLRLGMCKLCALLHNSTTSFKAYKNMTEWWESKSTCQSIDFQENSFIWNARDT